MKCMSNYFDVRPPAHDQDRPADSSGVALYSSRARILLGALCCVWWLCPVHDAIAFTTALRQWTCLFNVFWITGPGTVCVSRFGLHKVLHRHHHSGQAHPSLPKKKAQLVDLHPYVQPVLESDCCPPYWNSSIVVTLPKKNIIISSIVLGSSPRVPQWWSRWGWTQWWPQRTVPSSWLKEN